jgi:hypothetical protein
MLHKKKVLVMLEKERKQRSLKIRPRNVVSYTIPHYQSAIRRAYRVGHRLYNSLHSRQLTANVLHTTANGIMPAVQVTQ